MKDLFWPLGSTFFDRGTIDNVGGQIGIVFDTLLGPGPGANGSGILDSFTFRTVGNPPETSIFSLSDVLALNSGLNVIAVHTQALPVTVPEPAQWRFCSWESARWRP